MPNAEKWREAKNLAQKYISTEQKIQTSSESFSVFFIC